MFRFRRVACVAVFLFSVFTAANAQTGILADRLSPAHRKTWEELKQIILAEDAGGKALHPTMNALFNQLQASNHVIYLEFDDGRSSCRCWAGNFTIEQLDPLGIRHVAVIKLYLQNIKLAGTDRVKKSKVEFVPLAGLPTLDRYAEVLGHEMAHAVDILFDQERAVMVDQAVRETSQAVEQRLHNKSQKLELETERAQQLRDAFFDTLEKPAVLAEEQVWRELSHRLRG